MNVSAAFIVIRAFPIMFVYRNPWYSFPFFRILMIGMMALPEQISGDAFWANEVSRRIR